MMELQKKRTWAEIRLGNLEHNVRNMQAQLPAGCRYLGVVKANAYGHGAVEVSRRLETLGVTNLAVACFDEAVRLRQAGVTADILILGPSPAFLARDIAELRHVAQAVGSLRLARALDAELTGTGLTLPVHIKLETGMGRTGFTNLADAARAMSLPGLDAQGVFTHFCVSDEYGNEFTAAQFDHFTRGVAMLEERSGKKFTIRHCTNSGAMVNYPQTYLDMVRPGIVQYGIYPAAEHGALSLRPVMRLMTRVAELTGHAVGDTISYGRTYTCDRPRIFAVLPIGYADGLHRALSNRLEVTIGGKKAKQCGRICMDMCMVDVTDLPDVQVGDEVEIFGDAQSIDVLARQAGTISYELLTAVSPRVPRVYLD